MIKVQVQLGKAPPKLEIKVAATELIAAKLDTGHTQEPETDILLGADTAYLCEDLDIPGKLLAIEELLAAEGLPIERLKAGLKDVMLCLKDNEGSILELEPKDIKLIVQGYTSLEEAEIQNLVMGKKKRKESSTQARINKLAKEINLDEVEF